MSSHVGPPFHVVAFLYEVAMEYGKDVKDNDFDRIAWWIADAWDPDECARIQALQKLSAKHIENVCQWVIPKNNRLEGQKL